MATTTRKETPAQARKSAIDSDFTTLYALAGLTDTLAAQLKALLATTKEKAAGGVSDLKGKQAGLEAQVKSSADELNKFLKALPEQIKGLPETSKKQIAKAQHRAEDVLADANKAYGDFAGRGKRAVDEALVAAKKLSSNAGKQASDAAADVADKIDPAFEAAQEGVTKARQTVTGRSATESVTPRSSAQATATKAANSADAEAKAEARSAAAKRGAAKRAAAKKAPATNTAETPATDAPAAS